MSTVIKGENISKHYLLGDVSTGSLSSDITRWWSISRGQEDPYLRIDSKNTNTDSFWALNNISFNVKQGDVLGIIGKNGSGKSTLLKILSRVTTPTSGSFKVKGRITSLLEVGVGFHPDLTGIENVYLNGAILGMNKTEVKIKLDEIIDFSGIEKHINTPVKRYSSGMYVRLAFSVAAHLDPEILIVDEVLAVGDVEFQKRCLGKMKDVSKHGRTVLFVSHNMPAVEALCTRTIVLNNGELCFEGATKEGIKNYLNEATSGRLSKSLANEKRQGNGKIEFKRVLFRDEKYTTIENPILGEEWIIEIEYEAKEIPLKAVRMGFAINESIYGTRLTALMNDVSGDIFNITENKGIFRCTIPKLNILAGTYNLNLFCSVGSDISDWLINVINFEILSGDYFKTGKILNYEQSKFLMDYKWENENIH